jgi:hypothetical protein
VVDHIRRRLWQTWGAGILLAACGCASFWDEVTSRERDLPSLWRKPDPLVTLRDSTDYHRKAQALGQLHEPLHNGGTREQQELFLNILTRAALTAPANTPETLSRDPLCRLSAIRMLGTYKDPRALPVLEKAYFEAHPFTPDMNAMLRQQVLTALENTDHADARHILIRAARQPGASPVSSSVERQYILDEKLAAVRALKRYSQYDAIETMVHVLETEKDVALRDTAHEALKSATGRDLPADAKAWRDLIARGPAAAPPPSTIERVTGWVTGGDATHVNAR